MVAAMHASTIDSSMEHATAATTVPTASGNMSMHGVLPAVPSPPVFTAGHADEQRLFQSAKAIVQHHLGPVMGATMPMGAPEPQTYPPARATHEQVCDDPDLFQETLRELYDALDIKVAKVMKLGGQELNLHLLYQRVTDSGGALQVIRDKLWRDVGDAFDLPKTITSLSYVLKRGYMQYLWDYEQVYFHRKSCMPRVLPPASKYSKDQQNIPQQPASNTGGYQVSHPAMHMHAVDAAAAMAVAALRGRSEWNAPTVPQTSAPASATPIHPVVPPATSTYPQIPTSSATDPSACTAVVPPADVAIPAPPGPPEDTKVPLGHLSESSAAGPVEPAKDAVMHDDSTAQLAQHAQTTDSIVAHSMTFNAVNTAPTGQHQQDCSKMCALPMPVAQHQIQPLPLAAMLQSQPHTHLSSLVGKRGSFEVVQSAGPHGLLISGSIEGQPFFGVLGGSPGSSSCVNTPVAAYPRPAAADSTTAAGCNLVTAQSGATMCAPGDQGSDLDFELHAAKRTRTCEQPRRSTHSSSKALHGSQTHENMDSMYSSMHPNSEFERRAREAVAYPPRHGPQASPNTHTALLPKNRHMAYPRAPDHLVQPLPMGHGVEQGTEPGLGDCMDIPLYQGLGDFRYEDALLGAGELEEMLGLGDDFMLEEPV